MGCLVYRTAGLSILQALHGTVGEVPDTSLPSYYSSDITLKDKKLPRKIISGNTG